MRVTRVIRVGVAVAALTLLVGCGAKKNEGSGSTGDGGTTASGVVAKAKKDKKLVIGIKFDQPGLGQKTADGKFAGFDLDVAKYVAKELGVEESGITWKEAPTPQRENLIEKGEVDFVAATYSISAARKEKVLFAGPYLITGQALLVKASNTDITGPDKLDGKKLCSVTGSTSAQNVKDKFAKQVQLQQYKGYSECLSGLEGGELDALTTDETILAGYAAQQPGKFKVVGEKFSKENIGIGLAKTDTESRTAINTALEKMFKDGAWKAALDKHLGKSGITLPEPPTITEK